MKTYMAKPTDVQRTWYIVDAEGKTLGRLASQVAAILRGKHKPTYTPHIDTGDHVIIVNAEKIVLTGRKLDSKVYYKHSGYVGGLKEIPVRRVLAQHPERVLEEAISGMLPKTGLGKRMFKKLRVYAGPDTGIHKAQQPVPLDL